MSNPINTPVKMAVVAVALVLVVLSWISLQPEPGSPEQLVEEAIRELVAAAEARQLKPFKHYLSEDVKDGAQNPKREILRLMRALFFRNQTISLTIIDLQVQAETNPGIIHATLELWMGNTPIPEDKGSFEFTFRLEGSDWKIWELKWKDGAQYGR